MAKVAGSLPLFPDATDTAEDCKAAEQKKLVGIARLAASADLSGAGHLIEFRSLRVRSILNRSISKRRLQFAWSINPYRGCEFACRYCYARYTHEYMELRNPLDFERRIFIKQNASERLKSELKQVRPGQEIAIGTATDPYQPVERHARVTESLLRVLADRSGLRIGIVSKSTLIMRDIPLLQKIAAANELVVHLTITTPDAALVRLLEPRAPRPDLRFRTVKRLRQAGIRTGVLCSPLLPGITDTCKALDGMARAAKDVDANFFHAQALFLKPLSREVYMDFIREHFPQLEPLYEERYKDSAFVPKAYAARLDTLLRAACRKHGIMQRSNDAPLTGEMRRVPPASVSGPPLFRILHSQAGRGGVAVTA